MYYVMSIPELLVLSFVIFLWILSIIYCIKRYEKISTIERADMHTYNKIKRLNTTNNTTSNSNSVTHGMANANGSTQNLTNNNNSNNKENEIVTQQQHQQQQQHQHLLPISSTNKLVRQSNTQASLTSLTSGGTNLNKQTNNQPTSRTNFFNTSMSRSSTCSFNPINRFKQQETLATTTTINSNLNKQNSINVDSYYLNDNSENNCLLSNSSQTIVIGKSANNKSSSSNVDSVTLQPSSTNLIQQNSQNKSTSSILAHLNRTLSNFKNKTTNNNNNNNNMNKPSNPVTSVIINTSTSSANTPHLLLPRHPSLMLKSNSEPAFKPLVDEDEEEPSSSPKISIKNMPLNYNPIIKEDLVKNNNDNSNNNNSMKKSKPRLIRTISIDSNSTSSNTGLNTATKINTNTMACSSISAANNKSQSQKVTSTSGGMYQKNTNKYSLNSRIPNHYHQIQQQNQQYMNKNEPSQIVQTLNETNINDLLDPHLIPRLVRKSLIDLHKKSVWNLTHNPNVKHQQTLSSNNPATSPTTNTRTSLSLFSSKKSLSSSSNKNASNSEREASLQIGNYSTSNSNIQSPVSGGTTPPPLPPPPNEEIKMKVFKNFTPTNYHS